MANALRTLCAIALVAALTPFASAQGIDCDNVPVSAGAVDQAYRACVKPSEIVTSSAPTDQAFGHDGVNVNFVKFVQNTPQVFVPVAPYTPPVFLGALDFEGNNTATAFGLDTGNLAISINSTTGAVTNLGNIVPQFGEQWTALTYDNADQAFYALAAICGAQTSLYRVNFTTLTATLVGTDASGLETCGLGLASRDSDGALFGYGVVSDQLVRYNKTTGQATLVGPLGYSANFGQSMDFDKDDGTCYIYAFNDITFQAELRTCNTTTGATALVGVLGATAPGGLTQIGAGASITQKDVVDCSLSLANADISPNTVASGGTVTFSGQVVQAGPERKGVTLRATYDGPGSLNGSLNLGAASNVPPGTYPFSRPVNVPANAPSGSYVVTLQVINSATGQVCDTYTETITVTAPRLGGTGTVPFEVVAPDAPLFEASATTTSSAVAPNPFAGRTQIAYTVAATANVRLSVYDVLGREVAVLVDGTVEAGQHAATFDARGLAAGTYVYRLSVGNDVQTGRMTLTN